MSAAAGATTAGNVAEPGAVPRRPRGRAPDRRPIALRHAVAAANLLGGWHVGDVSSTCGCRCCGNSIPDPIASEPAARAMLWTKEMAVSGRGLGQANGNFVQARRGLADSLGCPGLHSTIDLDRRPMPTSIPLHAECREANAS